MAAAKIRVQKFAKLLYRRHCDVTELNNDYGGNANPCSCKKRKRENRGNIVSP